MLLVRAGTSALLAAALACGGSAETGPSAQGAAAPAQAVTWTAHVGTQGASSPWSAFVRGVGRDATGSWEASPTERARRLRVARDAVRTLAESGHGALLPVGGLDSARDRATAQRFLEAVEADRAAAWRSAVEGLGRELDALNGADVAWQVGNEINSRHWTRSLLGRESPDDAALIPAYAEAYLAPTVLALRAADADGGARQRIVLGSVANARRDGAREWMSRLLDYRLEGRLAEPLAGKRVSDVVDAASIHYLVTADDEAWESVLDDLFERWVRTGRLEGIWSTEELGTRRAREGLGAATVLKVLGRYAHWWSTRGVSPEQSRCFFFGWRRGQPGTRGADALQALGEAAGSTLQDVTAATPVASTGPVEHHAFRSADHPDRLVAILSWNAGASAGARVTWPGERTRGWRGTVAHFTPSGRRDATLTPPSAQAAPTLSIGQAMPPGSATLVVLTPATP